jgi:hypothetical protein
VQYPRRVGDTIKARKWREVKRGFLGPPARGRLKNRGAGYQLTNLGE